MAMSDGEEQKEAWLDEVNNEIGKYDFINILLFL